MNTSARFDTPLTGTARSDTARSDTARSDTARTDTARSNTARTALLFHALADEIRLRVVELLGDGERCVCELMADLDMAQSRLSWHLKTLSDAGIITGRREGRWNYYSLNPDGLAEARERVARLETMAREAPARSSCC
jgi:ArsR family transcriptional regulator, arsenate/arsenite/antimonite-responsive transcriptional repressor